AQPGARLMLLGASSGASDVTDAATAARIGARLRSDVIRPGFLEAAHVSAHLLAADIAVLPYVDGASPRRGSLLACAAHELPIVRTFPGCGAVAAAALPVPVGAAPARAKAVLRAVVGPALAALLRLGGAALAERPSWQRIAAEHIRISAALAHGG